MSTAAGSQTHYIFIDYENIQDFDLELIAGRPVKVFLIVGARRKTMPTALTRQLLRFHDQVELVESEGATPNALDLVLAYHVGQQAKADPKGVFHILSKDKDYDALVEHLCKNNVRARRDIAFQKQSSPEEPRKRPAAQRAAKMTLEQRVTVVLEKFKNPKVTRPAKRKTLLSSIHALLHQELTAAEVEQVLDAMIKMKLIEVSPTQAVTYRILSA